MKYGKVTMERYRREFWNVGKRLRVTVDGRDVSNNCHEFDDDDVEGYALLYRNDGPKKYVIDAYGAIAEEIVRGVVLAEEYSA